MPYEILDHPADAKFRATGDSIEEIFTAAVEAFSEIVGGDSGMYHHAVRVESENLEALLFDFLDELIFLQDSNGIVVSHASEMDIKELDDGWKLEAEIMTDDITAGTSFMDVKAPTYSEMEVEYDMDESNWVAQAVIDI
jgi:SHS2 domain-containing protein